MAFNAFHSAAARRGLALALLAAAACMLCRLSSVVALAGESGPMNVEPFQQLVRDLILRDLKEKYTDQKHWGQKAKVDRTRIKGKWFEPRLETENVEVNDGLWQRVEVTLVEPDKNLQVELRNRSSDSGDAAFSLILQAKIAGEAHIERWRQGIKGLNATVLFDATVRVRVDTRLGIRFEPGKLLSDVVLDPKVTAVELELIDFDLRKVGVLGRDVARELSNPLKPVLAHELKRREPKIVEKINAAIDKRRDHLRFSPEKYMASGWTKFADALRGPAEKSDK